MALLILLTATIDPMGRAGVLRSDPEIRLDDYARSLDRWLDAGSELPAELVFCENSGWPLDRLRELAADRYPSDRLRFLQFSGNDYPAELGKGPGEAAIIDHAIETVLADRAGSDLVVKCTGRLFVRNLRSLLPPATETPDLMCALDGRLTQADSRLFIARAETFVEHLAGMGEAVDEPRGIYFEHVLCRRVLRAIAGGCAWSPFPAVPRYSGWSATRGSSYDRAAGMARWTLHSALRTLRYRPRSPL
ncbi:MAG: hypothetical protein H0U03_01265 [Actinobacteria bacterium]|nr:hypothetical protein [Actinomycetota bacterium]